MARWTSNGLEIQHSANISTELFKYGSFIEITLANQLKINCKVIGASVKTTSENNNSYNSNYKSELMIQDSNGHKHNIDFLDIASIDKGFTFQT